MKNQLGLIFELNQRDLQIFEWDEALRQIPIRREEEQSRLRAQEAALESKVQTIADLEKQRREKEVEVEMSEARLKEFQGKLSQIKTNKEYQAALKEINGTKKSNKATEDEILALMSQIETLQKERESLASSAEEEKRKFEKLRQEFEASESELATKIKILEDERKTLLSQVDSKWLSSYQRIRKIRADAVSFVQGGTCQGCHMHIPPQLYIEIQKLSSLHTCPSCHRILYLQEWREPAAAEGGNHP